MNGKLKLRKWEKFQTTNNVTLRSKTEMDPHVSINHHNETITFAKTQGNRTKENFN